MALETVFSIGFMSGDLAVLVVHHVYSIPFKKLVFRMPGHHQRSVAALHSE
jgi:hypothetical protein